MKISDLFSVSGKVAIVTGGSCGIGEMITKGLVENGVKTYITARNSEELTHTAVHLSVLPDAAQCIPVVADLSSYEGVCAFADHIKANEEQIDILVNNAGAAWGEDFQSFPENGWDKVMDVNAKAPFS